MSLRFGKGMKQQEALQLNALQLAYIGDSVWELIVRYKLIMKRYNVHHMHKECVSLVNAHSQAVILQKIQDELNETETEIVRRGRNAHAKHSAPRNQDPDEYAASTGFEALFGYLYLTGQNDRISRLVTIIEEVSENG
ncbi:ribonuclease-3 family protein [Aristaeella hokkaidonensis]|nr:ribonuclease III domain-containing protein [Aristaeella hokkaidonensis]SNT93034.1 ribonuclease-3 family protein [Aristaeella hokkaidonensis]